MRTVLRRIFGRGRRDRREAQVLIDRWTSLYGPFRNPEEITATAITNLDKESGAIHPFIIDAVDHIRSNAPITPLLLAGEYIRVVSAYEKWLQIGRHDITTTGLGEVDVNWDYEHDIPADLGSYRLILSQAMLEHLIDPYKHVCDLYALLAGGGSLVMLTHIPGFRYHRHPIGCLRFYPDWFETVAQRLGAIVSERLVGSDRILYCLTKPVIDQAAD